MNQQTSSSGVLASLSSELAGVVERAGPAVVRVDDGTRLTATGTLWTSDGLVVATSHGVERDDNLAVELGDGRRLGATVVGRDPDTDIAVLRMQATGLPALEAASGDDVRVGHLALALGRPGDAGLQATIGIVSARLETQTMGQPGFLLHTDAVLYPGFSGGPLVDMSGRVVGINNLMYSRGRGVAIGAPVVAQVVNAVQAHGRVQRGYLGVRAQSVVISPALRQALGLAQEGAALVVQVESGSPAERDGLMLGDTLLEIDGQPVGDVGALYQRLRSLRAQQAVAFKVLRAGQVRDLSVTLGEAQ